MRDTLLGAEDKKVQVVFRGLFFKAGLRCKKYRDFGDEVNEHYMSISFIVDRIVRKDSLDLYPQGFW